MDRCLVCHKNGGSAGTTRLVYEASSAAGFLDNNYDVLAAYVSGGNGARLLGKMSGTQSHGGGRIYGVGTDEYAAFEEFVRLVEEEDASSGEEPEPVTNAFFQHFEVLNTIERREATLRRSTILLLGRNPSPSEISLLGDGSDAALRQAIRAATENLAFHEFLVRGANDRLLTDAFVEGIPLEQASLEGNAFYPLGTNAHADAQADAGERFFYWPKYNHWRWGLARAPLKLIAYIVSNDRDYRDPHCRLPMMNYAVSDFLNGGWEFDKVDPKAFSYCQAFPNEPCYDHSQFKPARNNGQTLLTESIETEETEFQTQRITAYDSFIDYPRRGTQHASLFEQIPKHRNQPKPSTSTMDVLPLPWHRY